VNGTNSSPYDDYELDDDDWMHPNEHHPSSPAYTPANPTPTQNGVMAASTLMAQVVPRGSVRDGLPRTTAVAEPVIS